MIDFDFSAEQRALAATARELFANESPPSRLRAIWDGAEPDPSVWKTMASVGLTGIAVAAEHGGMGGTAIDLALVLEEVGYAALPDPLAEAAAAGLLIEDPATARGLASGETVALATDERFVPDADHAAVVILDGVRYDDFTTERVPSIDHSRRLFRVLAPAGGELVPRALETCWWARASVLNGISRRLLDDTVSYAKDRRQFGAPIGSFQAVKHALAAGQTRLTAARAAAHHGAYALATDPGGASRTARVALVEAIDAHRAINRDALQIHAGIGFTFEHDLHLWLKRGLALAFGDAEHRAHLAHDLFGETPDA